MLSCSLYAGLQSYQGETFPGEWSRYVEPEDFYRLKSERAGRSHATKRRRGGPPRDYLLSEVAYCGQCGGRMQGCSDRNKGTRSYACQAHREHHKDSAEHCAVTAFDAAKIDQMVLANLDSLLADADAMRDLLKAGQTAERKKLEQIATDAAAEAKVAERAAEKATAEFADAEDDDERALLKEAATRKRADAKKAMVRADAALDALSQPAPQADEADVMTRIWRTLSGAVADAQGDVKVLNTALRENFDRFDLRHNGDGCVVVPMLSPAAAMKALA